MKKFLFFIPIVFIIIATTITKNSTKQLDKKIFEIKESIRVLEDKYELVLLDYNYLTSPKKLMDYQFQYFEKELTNIDINDIKELIVKNEKIIIQDFKQLNNE